eukprot:767480-Hanusia_phi.AAC.1
MCGNDCIVPVVNLPKTDVQEQYFTTEWSFFGETKLFQPGNREQLFTKPGKAGRCCKLISLRRQVVSKQLHFDGSPNKYSVVIQQGTAILKISSCLHSCNSSKQFQGGLGLTPTAWAILMGLFLFLEGAYSFQPPFLQLTGFPSVFHLQGHELKCRQDMNINGSDKGHKHCRYEVSWKKCHGKIVDGSTYSM